jgi:hypothetical protein
LCYEEAWTLVSRVSQNEALSIRIRIYGALPVSLLPPHLGACSIITKDRAAKNREAAAVRPLPTHPCSAACQGASQPTSVVGMGQGWATSRLPRLANNVPPGGAVLAQPMPLLVAPSSSTPANDYYTSRSWPGPPQHSQAPRAHRRSSQWRHAAWGATHHHPHQASEAPRLLG